MNLYILLVSIKGQTAEEATVQRGRDGGKLLLKVMFRYCDVENCSQTMRKDFLATGKCTERTSKTTLVLKDYIGS